MKSLIDRDVIQQQIDFVLVGDFVCFVEWSGIDLITESKHQTFREANEACRSFRRSLMFKRSWVSKKSEGGKNVKS